MAAVTEAPVYIRSCPTCGAENSPDVLRCACGALLAGIDLVRKESISTAVAEATPALDTPATALPVPVICPYPDCAQSNPPGSTVCAYCNRPLAAPATAPLTPPGEWHSLLNLPSALKDRYRVVQPLPASGAEAELVIVEALAGGPQRVAKIYRHGIQPRREVQERIAKINPRDCVQLLESGVADGLAYELMEFCAYGSLRMRMSARAITDAPLVAIVRELASALASVHAAGLVHRDLKPENVLVRSQQPLDLVLTDFSISSVLDATQRFTSVARTLPYAAPESLSGVIDGKSDYWALGMIILEAATGKHPYAGLSEAVILHHLATRSIDLSSVHDGNLRKVLRGLLLRDPAVRWGAQEVQRWLAGDENLAEPIEQDPRAGFNEPYRIGNEVCTNAEQLAVALARNWKDAIADMGNAQLLGWFRDVQKDQNAVRVLLELQYDRELHVDVRLLRFILYLAPGIPPMWRGASIGLRNILERANLALKGDADASQWLDALYRHHVLEAYATAGNVWAADVVHKWNTACDDFGKTWDTYCAFLKNRRAAAPTNFDDMVFGHRGPSRPALSQLHAKLLAIAYDAAWAERLRKRLLAELASLTVHCPWLADVGDVETMDNPSLLVLETLMPEARKAAEQQVKDEAQQRQHHADDCNNKKAEWKVLLQALRQTAGERWLTRAACTDLTRDIARSLNLLAEVRSSARSDEPWLELKRSLLRREPVVDRMQILVEELEARRAVNSGWMGPQTLRFFGIGVFALIFFRIRYLPLVLLAGLGLVAWRLAPNFFLIRDIRALAREL